MSRYSEAFLTILCLISLCFYLRRRWRKKSFPPSNWPLLGTLPSILGNIHRFHEFLTENLQESGGTFELKGPWLSKMGMMVTCEPANINYILSKNFANYPKGPEFKKIFDVLGEGIFNVDGELWEQKRKTAMSLMNNRGFQQFVATTSWAKAMEGLIPLLQHVADSGTEVDLQDVCQRFSFDATCVSVLGHDPGALSIGLPYFPLEKATSEAEEAIFLRHLVPEFCWRLLRWLQIGPEKRLSRALESLDELLTHSISLKRENKNPATSADSDFSDLLTFYMNIVSEEEEGRTRNESTAPMRSSDNDRVLKDTLLSLLLAGKDTIGAGLAWFFWLVATNPVQEGKICEEIAANLEVNEEEDKKLKLPTMEGLRKLVYLHGAICEALRLFPPVAIQHKAPSKQDKLPSGHILNPNTKTLLSFYSMARMESIWGKDCSEFKPERWITEQGGIKHEPSFKFTAFNTGPRSCLGKEMSFIQMKLVAAAVLYHFRIRVVDGHSVSTRNSVILDMKHGLKVKVSKRCNLYE